MAVVGTLRSWWVKSGSEAWHLPDLRFSVPDKKIPAAELEGLHAGLSAGWDRDLESGYPDHGEAPK